MSEHIHRILLVSLGLAVSTPRMALGAEKVRQPGNIGVGIGGSSYGAGVSGKYFVNEANAFQGLLGVNEGSDGLLIQFDYLYNFDPLWADEKASLGWYAGFGGVMTIVSPYVGLAGAGNVGLDFDVDAAPIDIFLEVRPTLWISPIGVFDLSGGGGVRYYF